MSIFDGGRRGRRRRRLLALVASAMMSAALIGPSSASAGDDWFCGNTWLPSTWQCRAQPQHWLWSVGGWVANGSPYRICTASAVDAWGPLNSDYRCDYGSSGRTLNGSVYGVGVVRNGATFGYQVAVGIQQW